MNTSCLWVQQKEASPELQYRKVKGRDNGADLFVKAIDHDSIVRYTEALELRSNRTHGHQHECKSKCGKLSLEVESRFKTSGRMDAWSRMDLHSKTSKTTNKGGPTWGDVAHGATAGAGVGYIINFEDATNIIRDTEHRLIEGGPRDLVTVLLLKSVSGRNDHLGAYDNRGKTR